jgi:hypothetical protein
VELGITSAATKSGQTLDMVSGSPARVKSSQHEFEPVSLIISLRVQFVL